MSPVRVYLPTTLPALAAALDAGLLALPVAYAVTPALREWYTDGDEEQLEYAAASAAAGRSLGLLAGGPGDVPMRRVVVAADVPDTAATPAAEVDRAAVRLGAVVPVADVVSAHVDSVEAQDDVRRAVAALSAAARGDEDARFVVDAVDDHELCWYATQELRDLVAVS